jgi:hypothetical protein
MKPRLQISLDPAALAVIRRIAKQQQAPASRVVSELIEEAAPLLTRMAETLEALEATAKAHKAQIKGSLEASEQRARAAALEVVSLLDDLADRARTVSHEKASGRTAAAAARRPQAPAAPSAAAPHPSNRGATPHRSRPVPRIATVPATTSDGHKGRALKPRPPRVPR